MTTAIKATPDKPIDIIKWNAFANEGRRFSTDIQITDDLTAARAVEGAKRVKDFLKDSEAARKEMKRPFAEMADKIDAAFRPITQALQAAEVMIKAKLQAYLENQEKLRLEEERKQQEAFEARKTDVVERSVFDGEDPEALLAITDQSVPGAILPKTGIRTDGALASQKKIWDYEITNEASLPRSFLMANEKAIAAAVRAGTRTIDGVRIFEKIGIAIR